MATRSELKILSICSGIGGLDLGTARAARRLGLEPRTVCYIEREAFPAACLVKAMEEGRMDAAPVWSDLRTFDCEPWRGRVDCLIGGFPCQPFSLAGKGQAEKDPRHLWPEVCRVLEGTGARFAFFENVPGLVRRGLREVVSDLSRLGFNVEWDLFSAEEEGAPHVRKRLFVLADADSERRLQQEGPEPKERRRAGDCREKVFIADAESPRLSQFESSREASGQSRPPRCGWWAVEPGVGRVANGIPDRTHRLRALGNAVVPQCAEQAFFELWGRMT